MGREKFALGQLHLSVVHVMSMPTLKGGEFAGWDSVGQSDNIRIGEACEIDEKTLPRCRRDGRRTGQKQYRAWTFYPFDTQVPRK